LLGMVKEGEPGLLGAIDMLGRTQGGAKDAIPLIEDLLKKEAAKADNMRNGDLINRSNQALVGIRQHLIGGWIASLKEDKDGKVRASSAAELLKVAQIDAEQAKQAFPVLVDALKDDNADVRKSALTALATAKAEPQVMMEGLIAIVKNLREEKDT